MTSDGAPAFDTSVAHQAEPSEKGGGKVTSDGTPAFDTSVANQARIYDYLLGGMDLVAPGLVRVEDWRTEPGTSDAGESPSGARRAASDDRR